MAVDFEASPRRPPAALLVAAGATDDVEGEAFSVYRVPPSAEGVVARARLSAINSGTPTLDAFVEDSWDGVNWSALIAFATRAAVGEETLAASRLPGPLIRARGAVGGVSPDVDFRVDLVGVEVS